MLVCTQLKTIIIKPRLLTDISSLLNLTTFPFKVAKFAQEEIAPIAAKMDRESKIPDSLVKKCFENGVRI